jgi:hypothetical protein
MAVISVLLMEGILKCTVEMGSGGMINLSNLMKNRAGVQAILSFCLRNFMNCNDDITDGRDLRITPLRWAQKP